MPAPTDIEKGNQKPQNIEDIFEFQEQQPGGQEIRERPAEVTRETAPDVQGEQAREDEQARRQYAPPPVQEPVQEPAPAMPKSPELQKIEHILSEHLDELFLQMTPEQQMAFQRKGEETASKIELLLRDVKVKVREILGLLRDWLRMIPGINKFFLEQEAKIKADRILNLHEQKHKQG
ncbi:MAG: hypothetical protein PHY34_02010 [Patescibacteria group bacterium]|nr:hypothetical protein [Patescibacteria group bacterium]MDD5715291.1 hypothetical protein [Patescibacteria group bacterium]